MFALTLLQVMRLCMSSVIWCSILRRDIFIESMWSTSAATLLTETLFSPMMQ